LEGIDVDLCRALAAAVLKDASAVTFRELSKADQEEDDNRWSFLDQKEVDVVMRSIHTAELDVYEPSTKTGYTFSTPYYYDTIQIGGKPPWSACANAKDTTTDICRNLSVCVQQGTMYETIIVHTFPNHHVVVPNEASLYQSFMDNTCNTMAAPGYNLSPTKLAQFGYTDAFAIGPFTDGTSVLLNNNVTTTTHFAKAPLSVATRQEDPVWSDVVEWTLQALFEAEERGITKLTASTFGTTSVFGTDLENLFIQAISAVGNYGELYA
jgi:general L-amino acid transport system substrate-binding protein